MNRDINMMAIEQLETYLGTLNQTKEKLILKNQGMIAGLLSDKIRQSETRLQYLKDKSIWDAST